jgi:hypothetical protein
MQPETKQKILSAFAEEFRCAGLPTLEEAHAQMLAIVNEPKNHGIEEFVSSGLNISNAWTPVAIILRHLDQLEEPTPEDLTVILKRIEGFRYEMRPILREATDKLLKTLLRRFGGRHLAIEAEHHALICEQVADLYKKRVRLRVAYKRVGARYNVSGKTIQRIWQKREREHEEEN